MIARASLILFCGGSRNEISLSFSSSLCTFDTARQKQKKKIFIRYAKILESAACIRRRGDTFVLAREISSARYSTVAEYHSVSSSSKGKFAALPRAQNVRVGLT